MMLTGYLSGRVYYAKRVGWRWETWFSYRDGSADPGSGATQWRASSQRFWRKIDAERAALDLWCAFNDGVWCEGGRNTPALKEAGR